MSVFAEGLHGKTNAEVHDQCLANNNSHADIFPMNNDTVDADIYKGVSSLPAFMLQKVGFEEHLKLALCIGG